MCEVPHLQALPHLGARNVIQVATIYASQCALTCIAQPSEGGHPAWCLVPSPPHPLARSCAGAAKYSRRRTTRHAYSLSQQSIFIVPLSLAVIVDPAPAETPKVPAMLPATPATRLQAVASRSTANTHPVMLSRGAAVVPPASNPAPRKTLQLGAALAACVLATAPNIVVVDAGELPGTDPACYLIGQGGR